MEHFCDPMCRSFPHTQHFQLYSRHQLLSCNLAQFGHDSPEDSVRSYKIKARWYQTGPNATPTTSDANSKSRLPVYSKDCNSGNRQKGCIGQATWERALSFHAPWGCHPPCNSTCSLSVEALWTFLLSLQCRFQYRSMTGQITVHKWLIQPPAPVLFPEVGAG